MQDATVQSIPQTSPTPAVAPSSYVTPSYQPSQAPVSYQAAPVNYQVAAPQAAPVYQPSAPTQYVPQSQPEAPAGNPWESAFNKVVNLLSAPVQSPFQGQPSAPTTTYAPANYGSVGSQVTQPSAPQTWSTNQAYSPSYSPTYSEGLSLESQQVLEAFGSEAPAILNNYALQLEGLLDSAVAWGQEMTQTLQGYAEFATESHTENLAYNEILTNPDVLSDYTLRFFGPEGPYPVHEGEADLESYGYPTEEIDPYAYGQFPAPPAAAAPQQPANFWGTFNEIMARDPQNAWRVLNQAQPNMVSNKLFVME
jgi:hypothetical protein